METDGIFKGNSLNKVLAYMDLMAMEKRRISHVLATELACITPDKEEEDVQIAAVMAALAQVVVGDGGQFSRRDGTPEAALGMWVHVIAIGQGEREAWGGGGVERVYLYRGWGCAGFLQRLQDPKRRIKAGIEIEYKSTALNELGPGRDQRRVARFIDRWLRKYEMC